MILHIKPLKQQFLRLSKNGLLDISIASPLSVDFLFHTARQYQKKLCAYNQLENYLHYHLSLITIPPIRFMNSADQESLNRCFLWEIIRYTQLMQSLHDVNGLIDVEN